MTQGNHEHDPVQTPQGPVCRFCRQVIIAPVLSFDDERLKPPSRLQRFRDAWRRLRECEEDNHPIDYVLIGIADELGEDWPDYIQQVAEKYRGNPPHVESKWKAIHG